MKRFIPLCTIFVSFSSFANDHSPITHEKLAFAAEEFNKEISQNLSLNLTQTVCGTIGCKSEITKNNAILSDVVFSGEINNSTNVSKINIDVTNRFDYTSNTLSYVCLSNNECKFYGPEEIQKANFAFENGSFLKERSKRSPNWTKIFTDPENWRKTGVYVASGLGTTYISDGFSHLRRGLENGLQSAASGIGSAASNTWNAYTNYHINRAQGHGIMKGDGGWITENTELNN
ncbi:MAG: hypothetical protein DCC88_10290, partial [Spirobacillus cienkowskii]